MRKRVLFKGHVQGVGFRYTALMVSRGYRITGYVKNLRDGSVEIVVEGAPQEITQFINDIKERKAMNIRSVFEDIQPETGEFLDFSIRF